MPLRVRLTLWYGLVLSLTLLFFCVALYLALQAALERDLDQVLRVRAAQVERQVVSYQDDSAELTSNEIRPSDLEADALDDFAEPGVFVQVVGLRGGILASSGTRLPVDAERLDRVRSGAEETETLVVGSGQRLRTLYWPIRVQNRVVGIIQVAETHQFIEDTMGDARNLMLGGGLALVAAALGSGWLITRRALSPVTAVTEAARHIAETGRFDRRLGLGKPRDELGALASTFNLMIDRVERMVQQQREFMADTSHELRNPLSIIRGNLDFVRRVTTEQSCLESVHEAEVEAARMSRLVNDLLLLAQADSGEFLACRPVRLDRLVAEVAEQAQGVAGDRVVQNDAPSEVWVQGDPDRLRQLLWNLVENALRYTPSGGWINLMAQVQHGQAVLAVADTGCGVPVEHETRIFERFYRADRSRTRATGGAGLGLAIVKHIAEAHGGVVQLQNRPGQGATFTVTLPAIARPLDSTGRETGDEQRAAQLSGARRAARA